MAYAGSVRPSPWKVPVLVDLPLLKLILQILLVVLGLLTIMLVLLHKGRGGGLSDMFGGGVSSSASASGVAERNLNRLTVTIAVAWGMSAVGLGVIERFL
ncbi:preprotein translocase subunit SecG [Brachybacterium saurashtrense]|uniref:Protein-export membrane protein SecG n=1 Tax=Brachybacterium saurashtrense TaxID=556288 RepID=A0A345YMA3_9MICO|nr:preprotein translocase subunit SecG [Brachybacterium saurashtrense]RRR21739.1 preprotein translocase subunit SecG [Brachybacterium saurashtrense]